MPPNLKIFVGADSVDVDWLLRSLNASYWGGHYTMAMVMNAIYRSLNFSACVDNEQVAYARILTDGAITSVLNDVIVDEKWRHRGIGTKLLETVFAHREVKPTICVVQARYENLGLYSKLGFVPVGSMFKRDPR